jgi:H+-translocating NAD(P) transhydrogenase subunit alpha
MTIGILKEKGNENRVALTPESVATLIKWKASVKVENGAGDNAFINDSEYIKAGAIICGADEIYKSAEIIIKINPPEDEDIAKIKSDTVWISILNALSEPDLIKKLAQNKITSFGLDVVPRTSRAQAMDILSSMATVSGYKAVLEAALQLPHFFPMFMTAAGTITPAKVLILGAGVAGLQALAIARKLGAVVEVFDVRSAVKEEVMSLGGKFVEVEGATDDKLAGGYAVEQTEEFKKRQAELIHEHASKSDVIICTAQIPGKKAPLLIRTATVEAMRAGSVIIDLAASTGGNCEKTQNDTTVIHKGVKIIGQSAYPSTMPSDASKLFGKNVINFLKLIIGPEGELNLNFEDDIVKGTCVTHGGNIVNDRIKNILNL